jgi:hypothetical protein
MPRDTFAMLRNATVSAVNGTRADVSIDGGTATGLPVYGGVPDAGDRVLVAVQGGSMVVLGKGGGSASGSAQDTSGHARGGLSGTVPSGTATKLTLAKHQGTADVTVSGTAATVNKAGYWAISALVSSTVAPAANTRSFASILLLGSPDSVISRSSYGAGESFLGVNAVAYLEAGQRIGFDYYNAGAAATIQTSFFYFKYLGPGGLGGGLGTGDADWKYPTLLNGYTDAAYQASFGRVRYRRLADGLVQVVGRVGGTSTEAKQVLFTFPAGYVPESVMPGTCLATPSSMGVVEVRKNGDFAILQPANVDTT